MPWVNVKEIVPIKDFVFYRIISGFVFECPSSIKKTVNKGKWPNGKIIKETFYDSVSARRCSFKNRGITGNLLTTILTQIRKPIERNLAYAALRPEDSVENTVKSIIRNSDLGDVNYDLMVYKKRGDMPDTEAIFYYIRNALAHGAFEVVRNQSDTFYLLESKKNEDLKAQMRLKESSLLNYISLANLTPNEIKELQHTKNDNFPQTKNLNPLEKIAT